jgi:hypothetical protein
MASMGRASRRKRPTARLNLELDVDATPVANNLSTRLTQLIALQG